MTDNRHDPPADSPGADHRKRGAGRLVTWSSAAIIAIYGLGYARTQSAAQAFQTPPAPKVAATAAPPQTPDLGAEPSQGEGRYGFEPDEGGGDNPYGFRGRRRFGSYPQQQQLIPNPSAPAAPPSGSTAVRYSDGTYSGTGDSRHGSVSVSVVVSSGSIAAVTVTGCDTRYPCSVISALPGEVVSRQSAAVDFVSGASDSSQAFMGAVAQALTQAQAG